MKKSDKMANTTGLYRVTLTSYSYNTKNGKVAKNRWKYQVKNDLLNIELTSNNLLKLKLKVLESHLNWGVTDLEQAKISAELSDCSLKELQGEYGVQIGDNNE